MRFIWDPDKAARNLQRHRVPFEEAMQAFFDPNAVDDYDAEHSDDEARFNLIGLSSRRLLFVVYTQPEEGTIRIISARRAEGKLQKIYEQQN
jgi:uncharacterized DUF497 family protein